MPNQHLTELERRRVRTLFFDAQQSYAAIQRTTGYGRTQIRNAIRSATPAARSGRPAALSAEEVQELVDYITASTRNRRRPWLELSIVLFDGKYGYSAIRNTLRRHGYKRYVALRKPPISEKNRVLRLEFANQHINWTKEQWSHILWSDETWVTYGRHRKTYVTRRQHEELNPTCVVERLQRKPGWMFWGSFAGTEKGPSLFWEKSWGSITSERYCERIVPLVDTWRRSPGREAIVLMQDNAPAHASKDTSRELATRGIPTIKWPPYSPDLNPIETCWNWMKDYIEDNYGDINKPSYDTMRGWVKEAWEAIPSDYLEGLIDSMPMRMQAVIDANGMHTKF
jgi:transposase